MDNWKELVEEHESLIGRKYKSNDGEIYCFIGLLHGDDDYYYVMWKSPTLRLLSCVGSIENHGFELLPSPP